MFRRPRMFLLRLGCVRAWSSVGNPALTRLARFGRRVSIRASSGAQDGQSRRDISLGTRGASPAGLGRSNFIKTRGYLAWSQIGQTISHDSLVFGFTTEFMPRSQEASLIRDVGNASFGGS